MSEVDQPPAICLLGPTASGKSDLALALCEEWPCEIVSVDSAQVYRGMDIGTAKPSAAERAQVPHWLIDIRDPAETYTAADFRRDALAAMAAITAAGKVPLLVGGTMLYFKALLEGLASMPAADAAVRAEIEQDAARHGWPHVHAQLAAVDPEAAQRIHPHHSQRIQRALEVYRVGGLPMSELHRQQAQQRPDYRFVQVAIAPLERRVLHERIAARFERMLEQGLVDEVQTLRGRGDLTPDLPAMRSVGYRQVWQYLDGELSRGALTERGVVATRQLAKRQLTWLRNWPELCWIHTDGRGRLLASEATQPHSRGLEGDMPLALLKKYLGVAAV